MSDIKSTVTADMTNSTRAVQFFRREFERLGVVVSKVNDKLRSVGQRVKQGLDPKGLNQAGAAAGRAGGVVGSTGSQILGAAGSGGIFGRIAVGAGLAAIAFKAFNAVARVTLDRTQKLIEAEKRLAQARSSAQQTLDKQATSGLAQADVRQALLMIGGRSAQDTADRMAERGIVGQDEAEKGVLTAHRLFASAAGRREALALAEEMRPLGIPVETTLKEAAEGPDPSDRESYRATRNRLLRDQAGFFGTDSDVEYQYFKNTDAAAGDRLSGARIFERQTDARIAKKEREEAIARSEQMIRERLAGALNPESAEQLKVFRENNQQIQELNQKIQALIDQAGQMNVFAGGIPLWQAFMLEQERARLMNAQAGAAIGSGG